MADIYTIYLEVGKEGTGEEKGFVGLLECLLPRLQSGGVPRPRMANQNMTPRISCIQETGSRPRPLQSRAGGFGATTRGRTLGRLIASIRKRR